MLVDLLAVAVLAAVGTRLFNVARFSLEPARRAHVVRLIRGIKPRHVVPVPLILAAVLAAALALMEVPGLDWGWWTALGGFGNPVTGGTERTVGTVFEWLVPLLFVVLLLPALPLLAEREEQVFRRGDEHRSIAGRATRGVGFGLVHAVMGIPLGAALALSIGGWYFSWCYLRGYRAGDRSQLAALAESTRAHLAYNGCIVVLLLVSLAATYAISSAS
ncbi:MAG: hypothetical protein ACRDJP_08085 [Actinomycetota bacterium]